MPVDSMTGFYMGADGFTWGRDFMTVGDASHPLFIDKMWYMFAIWGQLAYDPSLSNAHFAAQVAKRLEIADEAARKLCRVWAQASKLLPIFNCMHWHDFDFQWYPEGCCMYLNPPDMDKIVFADINEFIACPAMPGAGYASVGEYASAKAQGREPEGISPLLCIRQMQELVDSIDEQLPGLYTVSCGTEYRRTLDDIEGMKLLGHYFATKELAAVKLAVCRLTCDSSEQNEAVGLLREAAAIWKRYSAWMKSRYYPQVLTRLCGKVDLQEFDPLTDLDVLLAAETISQQEKRKA